MNAAENFFNNLTKDNGDNGDELESRPLDIWFDRKLKDLNFD